MSPQEHTSLDSAATAGRERARHLLNRIAYGPRPGDVERVLAMGIDRYIAEQLRPEHGSYSTLERQLRAFDILKHSRDDLMRVLHEQRKRQRAARRVAAVAGDMRGRNRLRQLNWQFQQVAVVRAARSERQLFEIMVDFWSNHFNVYLGKNYERALMPSYIEEAIRPHALGRFEDLLIATAKSPAMLYYLDNVQSVAAGAVPPQIPRARALRERLQRDGQRPTSQQLAVLERADTLESRIQGQLPRGPNENYARELLELHTLGVDGGYTQADIVDVARIFTGWSVRVQRDGAMTFRDWAHDWGEKVVLGQRFPAGGGSDDAVRLLRMLAGHPSTRSHVSRKLCMRFVHDAAPAGCLDAAVAAWERTAGDIRAVVAAIIASQDFWDPVNRGAKFKTPLEYVVSAVRAVGADPDTTGALARLVAGLGQPLYGARPPTGYDETREAWAGSGALLARLNAALALSSGRVARIAPALDATLPLAEGHHTPERRAALVDRVNRIVLGGAASANTVRVMHEQAAATRTLEQARTILVALAFASPEFQRQ